MARFKATNTATIQGRLYEYVKTGVTSAELDKLDGLTATATELNYLSGVTSSIRTQLNAKNSGSGNIVTTAGASNHLMSSSSYNTVTSSAITITPSSTASRVMYMCKCNPHVNTLTSTHRSGNTKVNRNGSTIGNHVQAQRNEMKQTGQYADETETNIVIDHPNLNTAVTYTLHQQTIQGGQVIYAHETLFSDSYPMRYLVMEMTSGQTYNWT